MDKYAKIALVVGIAGFATTFAVGYAASKQQGTATPTLPSWYTSTIGKIDNIAPTPGTFGWLAIAGAGIMLYEKFGHKL